MAKDPTRSQRDGVNLYGYALSNPANICSAPHGLRHGDKWFAAADTLAQFDSIRRFGPLWGHVHQMGHNGAD